MSTIRSSSHRAAILAVALLLAAYTRAMAHDFLVEPSTFDPPSGARLDVRLCVGDGFEGWPLARNEQKIERFAAISAQTEQPLLGLDGADPAGVARLQTPGGYVLAFESSHSLANMQADEFSAYLKEKGLDHILALRERRRETQLAARDAYSRHAKALIRVGETREAPADRAIGLRLELIAESAETGAVHRFKLLYDGKPLAGALVIATRLGAADEDLHARTDKQGRATLDLPGAGVWRVAAVHMIEARDKKIADWESLWASLTFESQAPRTSAASPTPGVSRTIVVCRNRTAPSALQVQR